MIEIESMCSECGVEVSLQLGDLVLLRPTIEPETDIEPRLVHGCEHCGATTVRTIAWRMARVLLAHGVSSLPDLELEPATEPHPEDPPQGLPLSLDDVLDMHGLLDREDWFDELVGTGPVA